MRSVPDPVDLDWTLLCDSGDGLLHLDHPTDHLFLLMQECFDAESRLLELKKDFAGWSDQLRASHGFRSKLPPAFVGALHREDLNRLRAQIPYFDAISKVCENVPPIEILDHQGAREELSLLRLDLKSVASDEERAEVAKRIADAQLRWITELLHLQHAERELLQKAHEFFWRLTELLDMDHIVQHALAIWQPERPQRVPRLFRIYTPEEYRIAASTALQYLVLDRKLAQLVKRCGQPLRNVLFEFTHRRIAWFEQAREGSLRAQESCYASSSGSSESAPCK